jgi:uridine phosphorylase
MNLNNLLNTSISENYLYNLNLTLTEAELSKFRGIKYVCMQGSGERAKELAKQLAATFLSIDANYFEPINLIDTSKYQCYRVGKILSVSHGMGNASISTLLHGLTKVLHYAGNTELEYIRIGTSGGINVAPGSVILTDTALMPNLVAGYTISALGKKLTYPTTMNAALNTRIRKAQPTDLDFPILEGNSIAADDFYQGQARYDGAIKPKYDDDMRQAYFAKVKQLKVLNFEMESTALAAFANRAGIPAAMIAVTLVNRFQGDQITAAAETLARYAERAQTVAINYLKSQLLDQISLA